MSAHDHSHGQHAHLRQLTVDPTHTQGIRERFLREMRRRFRAVRGLVREAAGYEDDVFELAQLADADEVERFNSDPGKTRAFIQWLKETLAEELELVGRGAAASGQHWTGTYIRAAYKRGWENARDRLQQAGVNVGQLQTIGNLGVPQRQLQRLYMRTYENLESVTEDAAPAVRSTLTQGLAEGVNPREMARRLTKEVRTIQRTQAEVLARTEVINSYSEATLDRYERAGQSGVTVSGEFSTADDQRVCPICEALEGREFTVAQMRSDTFQFSPSQSEPDHLAGEYPVKPPCHPQCRCAIYPVVQ